MKNNTLFVLVLSFILLPFALTGAGAGAGGAAAQARPRLLASPPADRLVFLHRGAGAAAQAQQRPRIVAQPLTLPDIKRNLENNSSLPEDVWKGSFIFESTGNPIPLVMAAIEDNNKSFLDTLLRKSKESNIEIPTYLNRLYQTNLSREKVTPLHLAIEKFDAPVVRLLLEHGADASLANPLDLAFRKALAHKKNRGTSDLILFIIELLLDYGADITAVNQEAQKGLIMLDMSRDLQDKIRSKLISALGEKAKREIAASERKVTTRRKSPERKEPTTAPIPKADESTPGSASEREEQHKAASEEKAQAMRRAAMTMPTPPGTGAGAAATPASVRDPEIARELSALAGVRDPEIESELSALASLIEQGARPEDLLEATVGSSGERVIIAAIQGGHLPFLNSLFEKSDKKTLAPYINKAYTLKSGITATPLNVAITHDSKHMVYLLIRYGAVPKANDLALAFSRVHMLADFMTPSQKESMVSIIRALYLSGANIKEVQSTLVITAFKWLDAQNPTLRKELEREWYGPEALALIRHQEEIRKKEEAKRKAEEEQREQKEKVKSDLMALKLAQEAKKEKEKEKARAKKAAEQAQRQAEAREKQLADAEQKRQEKAAAEKLKQEQEQEQAEKAKRRDDAKEARLKAEEKQREKEKADRDKREQEKLVKIRAKKQERKQKKEEQKKLAEQAAVQQAAPGEPAPGVIAEHAPAAAQLPKAGELDPALRAARDRQHKEASDEKAAAMRIHDQELERGEGEPVRREPQIEGEGSDIQPGLGEVEPGFVVEPGQREERKERKEEAELKGAAAGPAALRAYARPKSDEQLRKEHEAIAFLRKYKNGPRRPDITNFHTYALLHSGAQLPNDFYLLLVTELALNHTGGRLPKPLYEKLKTDGSCNWFKDNFVEYSEPERVLRNLIKREMLNFRLGKSILAIKAATPSNPELSAVLTSLHAIGTDHLKEASRYASWTRERKRLIALRKMDGGTLPVAPEISSLEELRALYPS